MSPRNTAARVLAKIAANDPARAIRPSEAVTQAWAEHIDNAGITENDAIDAVYTIYRNGPPERLPLAADIVNTAKHIAHQRNTTRRTETITACPHCDDYGWQLDTDGTPKDPAHRCTHPTVTE